MKIVIIGGTGLIGRKLGERLRERGHDATSASPSSGVNAVTGEGVRDALAGADVVVDVSNSPSFEDEAVLKFFETSTRNLLAAEREAGVAHHVALSVVGADLLPASGYMRAKVAQEQLIQAASIPYTIVRATQFFEFLGAIGESVAADGEVRLPLANMQPLAADDVASAVAEIAVAPPTNRIVEVAGPEPLPMAEAVGRVLAAKGDRRKVVADANAAYFGARLKTDSLTPQGAHPRLAATTLEAWLSLA
jgi:uncharacterized protein YbjT (DUF2867 family)